MVKIAVSGCVHGELEIMYDTVRHLEQQEGTKIELLLCCGDFQSTRNAADLLCMAVPPKYRQMNTFYKYYTGELRAPVLTVFVGGNHEASNYLQELPYGGWVAPNIYYLGTAGCVNYRGLRIAGLSGIFKQHDYSKPHYECAPYSNDTMRSVYHTRAIDVFRLSLLAHSPAGEPTTTELHDKEIAKPDSALESAKDAKISEKGDHKVKKYNNRVDIVLSHDWPTNVYNHGDLQGLLRRKPYFRDEVLSGQLGSPPLESLLLALKPRYWFAAHLHCAFAALVDHTDSCKNQQKEQKTDESDSTVAKPPPTLTRFLALDKVLPRRHFLQILDIEPQDGAECDSDVHLEPHNDVESESDEPNAKVRKCDSSLASDVATANSDNAVKQDDVSHQSDATSPAQMELNKESERSADGGGLPEAESADDSQKLVESSPADAEKPAGVQLQSHRLHLDPVFLAVLRKTDSLTRGVFSNLDTDPSRYAPTIREVSAIEADFDHRFEVPDNFEMTTPCDVQPRNAHALAAQITVNPQTTLLCTMLDIRHPNAELANSRPEPSNQTEQAGQVDFDAVGRFAERSMGQFTDEKVDNPDEIHLSDDDEGDGEQ